MDDVHRNDAPVWWVHVVVYAVGRNRMNTQRKHEILNELDTLRKQVDFLESHHTLGMVNDEQYQETGLTIMRRVAELEEECEINRPIFNPQGLMYQDDAEIFNEELHRTIEGIDDERAYLKES